MKYNAYNLRENGYRYLRGNSSYVEKAESYFDNGIIVPSGMAAISLLIQYHKPLSVWYPDDLYQGTYELIELLGLAYNDKNPDLVIYDNPSFVGNDSSQVPEFSNDPVIIVDNSVMPDFCHEGNNYDYIVTSLSKYHTDCRTVLGLITVSNKRMNEMENIRELRWKSGYLVSKKQCKVLEKRYADDYIKNRFIGKLCRVQERAEKINSLLFSYGLTSVVSGGMVFVILPDDLDAESVALATPFELRPTYGAERTFCTYSYCDNCLRYFRNYKGMNVCGKYIRISPGIDMSEENIAKYIYTAVKKNLELREIILL